MGYFHEQATRPVTLGIALGSSPVSLAAWIVEKFHGWADLNDPTGSDGIEERFSKEELLNNIMIYWITDSATSSVRLYYE